MTGRIANTFKLLEMQFVRYFIDMDLRFEPVTYCFRPKYIHITECLSSWYIPMYLGQLIAAPNSVIWVIIKCDDLFVEHA